MWRRMAGAGAGGANENTSENVHRNAERDSDREKERDTLPAYPTPVQVGDMVVYGFDVGSKVRVTSVDVDRAGKRGGRAEATTVAEVVVDKCESLRFISSQYC